MEAPLRIVSSLAAALTVLLVSSAACAQVAAAAAPASQTQTQSQTQSPATVQPPSAAAAPSTDAQPQDSQRQRASLDVQRALSATLMVTGSVVALGGFAFAGMTGLCAIGDSEGSCDDREEKEQTLILIGAAGLGVAITGFIWFLVVNDAENKLDAREAQQQGASATLHLQLRHGGADAGVRVMF